MKDLTIDYKFKHITIEDIELIYYFRSIVKNNFLKKTDRNEHYKFIEDFIIEKKIDEGYFSYQNKNEIVGFYRYTVINKSTIQIGSLITNPSSSVENKIKMDFEFKKFVFEQNINHSFLIFSVNRLNAGVIYLHIKSGAKIINKTSSEVNFKLYKPIFLKCYEKFYKIN